MVRAPDSILAVKPLGDDELPGLLGGVEGALDGGEPTGTVRVGVLGPASARGERVGRWKTLILFAGSKATARSSAAPALEIADPVSPNANPAPGAKDPAPPRLAARRHRKNSTFDLQLH